MNTTNLHPEVKNDLVEFLAGIEIKRHLHPEAAENDETLTPLPTGSTRARSISGELSDFEGLLKSFWAYRNDLIPINHLPDNVLVRILTLVVDSDKLLQPTWKTTREYNDKKWVFYELYYQKLHQLRLVCRRWAEVVAATPLFWRLVIAADPVRITTLRLSRSEGQRLCLLSHKTRIYYFKELRLSLSLHQHRIKALKIDGWGRYQARILVPIFQDPAVTLDVLELHHAWNPYPETLCLSRLADSLRALVVDADHPRLGIPSEFLGCKKLEHLVLINIRHTAPIILTGLLSDQTDLRCLYLDRISAVFPVRGLISPLKHVIFGDLTPEVKVSLARSLPHRVLTTYHWFLPLVQYNEELRALHDEIAKVLHKRPTSLAVHIAGPNDHTIVLSSDASSVYIHHPWVQDQAKTEALINELLLPIPDPPIDTLMISEGGRGLFDRCAIERLLFRPYFQLVRTLILHRVTARTLRRTLATLRGIRNAREFYYNTTFLLPELSVIRFEQCVFDNVVFEHLRSRWKDSLTALQPNKENKLPSPITIKLVEVKDLTGSTESGTPVASMLRSIGFQVEELEWLSL